MVTESIFDYKTTTLMQHAQLMGLSLVGVSILVVIGWKMMISSIENADKGNEGKGWDIMAKARIIAIGAMVSMYGTFAVPIIGSMLTMANGFKVNSKEFNDLNTDVKKQIAEQNGDYDRISSLCSDKIKAVGSNSELAKILIKKMKAGGMNDDQICNYFSTVNTYGAGNTDEGILAGIMRILSYLTTGEIFAVLVHTITSILAGLIKFIMYYVVLYTLKVLIVIGPIAWAVSIFDFSRDQWKIHLHFTLNTCFVFAILNILDYFVLFNHMELEKYSKGMSSIFMTVGGSMANPHQWQQVGFDLATIGLYLQAGSLASAAIGKNITSGIANSAAAIGGVAVAAAAAALKTGVSAATGGKVSGGGGGSKMGGSLGSK